VVGLTRSKVQVAAIEKAKIEVSLPRTETVEIASIEY